MSSRACLACGSIAELVLCAPDAYLCKGCIVALPACLDVQSGPPSTTKVPTQAPELTPQAIVTALDKVVIGQTEAKRALAVAGWKHLQRIAGNPAPKSHVLLYGPTGCGKTLLAQTLAGLIDVPFVSVDATSFSEAGYRGRDVSEIAAEALDAADGDIPRAQHAVVFVDEFDKLCAVGGEARAAYQRGTQHGFLTLLEGTTAHFEYRGLPYRLDTSGMLFLFAGAFSDLPCIIAARTSHKRSIGFGQVMIDTRNTPANAIPADFICYGMEPELMGRIPVLAPILPLTEGELVRVLTQSSSSLYKQYGAFFAGVGREFSLTPEAAALLAQEAYRSGRLCLVVDCPFCLKCSRRPAGLSGSCSATLLNG